MSGIYKTNLDPGLAFDIRWPMAADDDTIQFEGWDQLPMPSCHQFCPWNLFKMPLI
jgi:hypothetical protein